MEVLLDELTDIQKACTISVGTYHIPTKTENNLMEQASVTCYSAPHCYSPSGLVSDWWNKSQTMEELDNSSDWNLNGKENIYTFRTSYRSQVIWTDARPLHWNPITDVEMWRNNVSGKLSYKQESPNNREQIHYFSCCWYF